MLKNLTIFNVKYLWSCCILHSCQVLGGKWLVWFGLLRVVPYNMASLATVHLGRANSFMVLFVLTAVHPLKSQPCTAWYCIQLDNGEGITEVRPKRQKRKTRIPPVSGVSDMILVCIIWFLWRKMTARYRDCTILSGVLSSYIQYGAIIVRYLGTFRNCYWWAKRNS